ncbi:MAG: desampylase [Halanaeroarchaeum sp.]
MLVLSRDVYRAVLEHAREDAPREACGMLSGRDGGDRTRVLTAYRTANVAETPRLTYRMDPDEQYATMATIEDHGQSVVGFYHSHPAGPDSPSATDVERADWPDHHYLIVSLARRPPVLDAWRWTGEQFYGETVTVDPPR